MERIGEARFDDFSVTFSHWLENEMQYSGPISSDILSRIAHGKLSPLFRFLVSKIKSKRTVETVLGNLMLQSTEHRPTSRHLQLCGAAASTMSGSERQKLLVKRERLLQQLENLKMVNQQLVVDLAVTRNTVMEKEKELNLKRRCIDECRHQTCLLEQQALVCGKHLHSLNDTCGQLKVAMKAHREKGTAGEASSYSTGGDDGRLESNCVQQTRAIVQQTKEFLLRHYQASSDRRGHEDGDKQAVWSGLEVLSGKLPASAVLSALRTLAKDQAQHVTRQTQKIDLTSDAERLRLQGDKSTSRTVLDSLQNLIQTSQLQHIEQFTVTQQLSVSLRAQQQHALQLLQHVHRLQQKALSSQPHLLMPTRSLFSAEVENTGLQSELAQWTVSLKQSKERLARSQQERVDLVSTHEQISSFTATVDENQSFIAALVKYNSDAFDRLDEQQNKVRQYVQRSVVSRQADVTTICALLRDQMLQASRCLALLPLERLLVNSYDKSMWLPVCDMSIHRHGDSRTSGAIHHPKILHSLHFPQYKCTDMLLKHVLDALDLERINDRHYATLKSSYAKVDARRGQLQLVKDHLALSESQDKRDRTILIPQVDGMCRCCSDSLTKCVRVQQLIEEWWEQPAQFLVPWHLHRDLSLQQWMEQFVVLATKWHQKQLLT